MNRSKGMYPLDFEEFLQVFEVSGEILEQVKECFLYRKPAAVEKYRKSGDINAVMDEYLFVIEQYKLDFIRYEEEYRKLVLTWIYGKAVKLRILNREPDFNKGAIYENVIAQELHAHGFSRFYMIMFLRQEDVEFTDISADKFKIPLDGNKGLSL